jgi:hypothetical protein
MVSAPFYSDKDTSLIKDASVRDYLGVLPVWSQVARALEPNLSGAIAYYQGFSAVLFIYHLEKNHFTDPLKEIDPLKQTSPFRTIFQYIELLVEYFLCKELNIGPCYGSRLLNSNSDKKHIQLSTNSGSIANGLYQFYRGSCRRAKMLSNDWALDAAAESALEQLSKPHSQGIIALITVIEQHLKTQSALKPYDIFSDDTIYGLFNALFSSVALVDYYKRMLFADEHLAYYANVCQLTAKTIDKSSGSLHLARTIKTHIHADNINWQHSGALDNILHCEPFLSALDNCFKLLHISDGNTFDDIATYFDDPAIASAIQHKAKLFLTLAEQANYQQGRFQSLFVLAQHINDKHYSAFLLALAQYHQAVMHGRGAQPSLLIEGQTVRSIVDIAPKNTADIKASLENLNSANNGYYIRTTARIYRQLFASPPIT